MYSYFQPDMRICGTEKIVLRLSFLLLALTVFSTQSMTMDSYKSGNVLKGYVKENAIIKGQSDDALFLMRKKWAEELKAKYGKNTIESPEEGIVYVGMVKSIGSRCVKINISEINRNINPNIEIIPQLSEGKMHSRSKINDIANVSGALVAINGTYFKQDTGTALGTLVINNEIISGSIYERAAFGIGDKEFKTARVGFKGEIKHGDSSIGIDNINRPRMMSEEVLMYTRKWGVRASVTGKIHKNAAIKDNVVVEISKNAVIIPDDGYVISAPEKLLKNFKLGDKVEVNYGLTHGWDNVANIISGGPYLVKGGKKYIDTKAEKLNAIAGINPRTAIGYTKDNVMIIVTVDGRKEGSSGMTLNELSDLMIDLGCYEAINLDGGSSTAMYAFGNVYSGTNIKSAVPVSNALIVRNKA